MGDTPNAAFAALSAVSPELGNAGLSSGLEDLQHFFEIRNHKGFTECQDRRCRAYNGMGLLKADKVALTNVHCTRPATTSTSGWSLPGPVFSLIKAARCCSTRSTKQTTWATVCSHRPMFCTQLCTSSPLAMPTPQLPRRWWSEASYLQLCRGLRREAWASATKSSCSSRCGRGDPGNSFVCLFV